MKVAIAQLMSSPDKDANRKKAIASIAAAKAQGAEFVLFPEMYMAFVKPGAGVLPADVAEPLDGPFVSSLAKAAKEHGVYVVCGIYEAAPDDERRAYNTIVVLDKNGALRYHYRKTHLYDAFSFHESAAIIPGMEPFQAIETEHGTLGVMVCYEVRFPEISRQLALQGADFLFIPAGWVAGAMKEDHWEILVRARAIENTTYVCAANQVGNIFSGRSMIVDPMGVIVASAGEEEGLIVAELAPDRIARVREKLPSVSHRRPAFYTR